MIATKQPRLGDILLEKGFISPEQLSAALEKQKNTGQRLGRILVDKSLVSEQVIINMLEQQLGIPQINLNEVIIPTEVARSIPEQVARKYHCLAYRKEGRTLFVAMTDPLNVFAIDDLAVVTKCDIEPSFALKEDIKRLLDKFYGFNDVDEGRVEEDLAELTVRADEAPIIKYVNNMFNYAIKLRASDIHLEPQEDELVIRFRIDGVLQVMPPPHKDLQKLVIPRVKLMANMNIAEKRVPQDGRIEVQLEGKGVDLRVSSLPTIDGEKIVIRVLDKSMFVLNFNDMGFSKGNLDKFLSLIGQPFGMILVTGPTGCGKTTTLYTALSHLKTQEKNFITVEDPVEYRLRGINQVQVNPKAGLTFANGLRSILRQDPNVIMVGEIRDNETADIAIRAALTGHLVLSTLHTNDAAGAITRLIDMGVEPFLVSSSVVGVVSQRLVRKICKQCKEPYLVGPEDPERHALGVPPDEKLILYKGKGCSHCNRTGYSGRTALHEILVIDKKIRELINERSSSEVILAEAVVNGMKTLHSDGLAKMMEGITSYQEVVKVALER